ncbi:MAG: Tim44/TimA family putative adaptor protein [Paracoccaceae bacterium]
MGSQLVQIIVLAGVALFLVLRLRNVLGTRDGFEPTVKPTPRAKKGKRKFEVIDGGGDDRDISDHIDVDSDAGKALLFMKKVEPAFSVTEFSNGARQAYEMILMAFENGDQDFLKQYLSTDVFKTFAQVIVDRADKGLTVEATFIGVRSVTIKDANFADDTNEAEITMKFVGELTSAVRDSDGEIIEGDATAVKRQTDVWTFARTMGGDNPNWLLVGTGA